MDSQTRGPSAACSLCPTPYDNKPRGATISTHACQLGDGTGRLPITSTTVLVIIWCDNGSLNAHLFHWFRYSEVMKFRNATY